MTKKKSIIFFLYVGGNATFFSSNTAAEVAAVIIGLQAQVSPMSDAVPKILRSAIQLQDYYSSFQKDTSA